MSVYTIHRDTDRLGLGITLDVDSLGLLVDRASLPLIRQAYYSLYFTYTEKVTIPYDGKDGHVPIEAEITIISGNAHQGVAEFYVSPARIPHNSSESAKKIAEIEELVRKMI